MAAGDEKRRSAIKREVERVRRTAAAVLSVTLRDSEKVKGNADLAKALGVSEDTVSAMLNGKRKIELGHLFLAAKAFDIPPLTFVRRILEWD